MSEGPDDQYQTKAQSPTRRPWWPVALSALVCPGFGQWAQGRRWTGSIQAFVAIGLMVGFMGSVFFDILALVPEYPPMDFEGLWSLAWEITHQVTETHWTRYVIVLTGFAVVYLYSVADAVVWTRRQRHRSSRHKGAEVINEELS